MAVTHIFFLALVANAAASSADLDSSDAMAANPIRKVVNMLQMLQKKVTAEGETEAKLYDKFNCYCKNSGGTLSKSVSDAKAKIPQVTSDVEEAEAKQKQDKEDLKQAHTDRDAAKSSMAQAMVMREKAAADFATEKAESTANIAALGGAIASIEKGMTGFVQTDLAQHVRQVAVNTKDLNDFDRQSVLSFLSGAQSNGYAPASGQITGILKQLKDTMSKEFAVMQSSEAEAVASHEQLVAAKTKQVNGLTKMIETKTVRVGSLAVEIAEMKNDLSNTKSALDQDTQFLANMDRDCATKASEYETNVMTRSQELLALADAIKMLNSDDALELFKKTLPSASSSFLQMKVDLSSQRAHARTLIAATQRRASDKLTTTRPGLDFIALALQGKKVNFEKVIKMIDAMLVTLAREQTDDTAKQEYCTKEFDFADDKKKGLQRSVSDLDTAITTGQDAKAALKDEIEALENGIKALDKEVADATEQRKEQNKDYKEALASDGAAQQLLHMAKDRLNAFYNPKKALPQEESAVLAQVYEHQQVAPPPAPETAGAYSAQEGGALAMLDTVVNDLDKEMLESKLMERDSQHDYEQAMTDSAERRALSTKTLTDKGAAKASVEAELETNLAEKGSTSAELMATDKFISSLHGECDFLMQYFDVRKEARDGEISSLQSAKNVLSGADFSFVQLQQGRRLRGVA